MSNRNYIFFFGLENEDNTNMPKMNTIVLFLFFPDDFQNNQKQKYCFEIKKKKNRKLYFVEIAIAVRTHIMHSNGSMLCMQVKVVTVWHCVRLNTHFFLSLVCSFVCFFFYSISFHSPFFFSFFKWNIRTEESLVSTRSAVVVYRICCLLVFLFSIFLFQLDQLSLLVAHRQIDEYQFKRTSSNQRICNNSNKPNTSNNTICVLFLLFFFLPFEIKKKKQRTNT